MTVREWNSPLNFVSAIIHPFLYPIMIVTMIVSVIVLFETVSLSITKCDHTNEMLLRNIGENYRTWVVI